MTLSGLATGILDGDSLYAIDALGNFAITVMIVLVTISALFE